MSCLTSGLSLQVLGAYFINTCWERVNYKSWLINTWRSGLDLLIDNLDPWSHPNVWLCVQEHLAWPVQSTVNSLCHLSVHSHSYSPKSYASQENRIRSTGLLFQLELFVPCPGRLHLFMCFSSLELASLARSLSHQNSWILFCNTLDISFSVTVKWCLYCLQVLTLSARVPGLKTGATARAGLSPSQGFPKPPTTTSAPALSRLAGGLSELTQTSQDEKTLNLNVILQGPQRIHCVGIQKDIPGCERGSFLFSAHWPPPSLSGAACLSLTTAACCLWRPGVSGAAPDICRPWAWAA